MRNVLEAGKRLPMGHRVTVQTLCKKVFKYFSRRFYSYAGHVEGDDQHQDDTLYDGVFLNLPSDISILNDLAHSYNVSTSGIFRCLELTG